ncbi:NHL repeat-containing protein [Rhodopirellula sallentina]|uniref:NHL repeat containing protein n=1 Tax=Rhodopirellula sallentina SM41 TaxID=1263870 RepID=M5TTN3_9BACT|nr:NHL repeat-containing protein [Rhodopirellula sallentina]EMI52520.1 NHL repeat containing protein [Rhodopirellula sallentina SM41]
MSMTNAYPVREERPNRRKCLATWAAALSVPLILPATGCVSTGGPSPVDLVWGRRGLSDGRFLKPRAITIDPDDNLYIVDTTGRIQVFDVDGNHLRTWKVPDTANGRPTGLSFDKRGGSGEANGPPEPRLLVADTHYYRMLVFSPDGELQDDQQIGGVSGSADGEFAFVTDAVSDQQGNVYIGEYGASDRIQKFSADGEFIASWGGTGEEPGRFLRPQSLVIDGETLWIADACNHRIVRYDLNDETPQMIGIWGDEGKSPGKLHYPYDLAIDRDGTVLICEYGNQRIQRFTAEGELVGVWGSPGHDPGQLYQPWGVVIDSSGRAHVLDSNNHRVQRVTAI